MKPFDFTTMIPQVDLFSFVFWEKQRHQKDILKLTDLNSFVKLVILMLNKRDELQTPKKTPSRIPI